MWITPELEAAYQREEAETPAKRIYVALKHYGVEIGNVSVTIINAVLEAEGCRCSRRRPATPMSPAKRQAIKGQPGRNRGR